MCMCVCVCACVCVCVCIATDVQCIQRYVSSPSEVHGVCLCIISYVCLDIASCVCIYIATCVYLGGGRGGDM